MTKAEKTRQQIIEKTAPIFNAKGYATTSLSDITAATGLTKGSIYGNFKDKDEVAIEAFKYNVSERSKGLHIAENEANNPLEALIAMIEFYRDSLSEVNKTGGCPMLNAAVEADDHLLFMKETVKINFIGWQKKFIKTLNQGQEQGFIRTDISIENYAMELLILIEGGILLARTLEDKHHLDLALNRALTIINNEIKIKPIKK